ncbi:diguanylate cyclase domain-containing protein [Brevibacillus ginsengisoli]|uniref:diguanylate cyclase domain-containing protein n=1 Tax=Brevibacillus ginsengisoli TaxID=363854 RepID=UPI003CFBA2F4
MVNNRQMLGKLETVFMYMTHFFLSSWPEDRPGILFLTDGTGRLIKTLPLQAGQTWNSDLDNSNSITKHPVLQQAISTREISVGDDCIAEQSVVFAAIPIKERGEHTRAIIGLLAPKEVVDFDLLSFAKGITPLIAMGYDAYIQHATGDILMKANRYDRMQNFMQCVIDQLSEIIDKGTCHAVRLDEAGMLVPHERITANNLAENEIHLTQLIQRFALQRIEPTVTDEDQLVIFPIYCEGKPLVAMFLQIVQPDGKTYYDERDVAFLQEVGEKISYALLRAITSDQIRREAQKKDLLYELTKKIQASIDVNDVLEEIIRSIHQLYSFFEVELYLTVDTNTTLPVKQLSFQTGENDFSSRAYLEGTLVVGKQQVNNQTTTVIAAPLLGKQGIYGVLELTATEIVNMSSNETDYISILAETAGTAFENAQLYQQSRNLIRELRLINEMAQQLNRSLNLKDILQFVTEMLLETFEAEYSAILQKRQDEDHLVVLSSSNKEHTGKWIDSGERPIADILQDKQAVILAHSSTEIMPFSLIPFSSFMGVPLLREGEVAGVLLVADSRRHYFSFDDFKLLEIFGQHTSLAITNAMLHSEVERMVITDNLTGLYARRYLNERVKRSLEMDAFGSLILIDIDYFKKVNDTYGHQVGDEVLIQVSQLIRQCIRESDIAARWGGEELAIYLPRIDQTFATNIAERIRSQVEGMTSPMVTISVGVAKWEKGKSTDLSVETLFNHADMALYEAKNNGRNQVIVASN